MRKKKVLTNKNIILGVTGGIAAYKSCEICSRLSKLGANVKVIMTDAAQKFVSPLTFQTMSSNPVYIDMFKELDKVEVEHIALAKWADIIVIAPCSANTIAKLANGFADNMLTTVTLASRAKKLIIPAMNTGMLENKATVRNMDILKEDEFFISETQEALLACKDVGKGKMLEPIDIVDLIEEVLSEKDMAGKTITITAGPTREALDPVRFLSNYSSGKMGYALAREALHRGARVNLISGPTALNPPRGANFIPVNSTEDMFKALESYFAETDILIKSAAPCDFTPLTFSDDKIKKKEENMILELKRTPDILSHFAAIKGDKIIVGFAAESTNVREYARDKMKRKKMDLIVANNITAKGAGFACDTNQVIIIDKDGREEDLEMMTKKDLAGVILDRIKKLDLF